MSKISVVKHLKKLKKHSGISTGDVRDVRHYDSFPPKVKNNLKKLMPLIKTATLATAASVLSMPTLPGAYNSNSISETVKMAAWQKSIDAIANEQTQQLQQKILDNIDSLQQQIISAKQNGKKTQFIQDMFNKVYPKGGLSGNFNYCVAGAMYAQSLCHDEILKQILPDAQKNPRDYNYSSHPNVSCPYMRSFFKENMPQNYAEKGDENFKETIQQLEAGDIITISSSFNTSSGEHCVTCAGSVENGSITVKGFNGERTYKVPVSKIVGAARIMNQYRQNLTEILLREKELSNVASLSNSTNTIDFEKAAQLDYVRNKILEQKQRG